MRQSLGIEVMRAQLLMCLVVSGGRSLEGNGHEGLVNVKVVANISRFNRENGKSWKNGRRREVATVIQQQPLEDTPSQRQQSVQESSVKYLKRPPNFLFLGGGFSFSTILKSC
jgi:hypothetical protein